jgi:hypothetical protein
MKHLWIYKGQQQGRRLTLCATCGLWRSKRAPRITEHRRCDEEWAIGEPACYSSNLGPPHLRDYDLEAAAKRAKMAAKLVEDDARVTPDDLKKPVTI